MVPGSPVACYNTALVAGGMWVTVRWDAVELADSSTPDISAEEEFFENQVREAEAAAEEDWPGGGPVIGRPAVGTPTSRRVD